MGLAIALAALVLGYAPEASALGKSPPPATGPPAPSAPAPPSTPAVKPASSPVPATPVAGAIAAPDIPLEADRLLTTLKGLEDRITPKPSFLAIVNGLPNMVQRVADAQVETKSHVAAASTLSVLNNLADLWADMQATLKTWADQLRDRATEVGVVLGQLDDLADRWTRTREEARRTKAPPALLKRIDDALGAIATLRKSAAARRTELLTLQVKVGEQLAAVQQAAAQVAQAKSADLSTLLHPDRPPVWRAWRDAPPLSALPADVRDSVAPQIAVLQRFLADHSRLNLLQGLLFLILAASAVVARRRARVWAATGTDDPMLRVLDYPVSTALIVGLILTEWIYERQPLIAVNLLGVALLVPVIRIVRRVTSPPPTASMWMAATFFVLNRFRDLALLNSPAVEQTVVMLSGAGGAAALVWLWWRQQLVIGTYRLPVSLVRLAAGTLMAASLAAVFGYMRLARLLNGGILRSLFSALGAYAGLVVVLAVFAYLLRVWPLACLHMVTRYRLLFERRAAALLWWVAAAAWLLATLQWFSLLDEAQTLGMAVLDYHVTRGFLSVSLGDALALVATIWAAFLLSRFVRFALEEDIYPRLPMGRGLPYAISSLLHYAILLLGFLVAIAAMGVDVNRLTLLTGAFGVGVGFGLQTIVNNFVSGLILLLERPIQVGDAIQMGDLDGEVRRIGIRSTTVHTGRGAEVIVPNATLISGNLTNWTLRDRIRRLDLSVGVAYGTDPQRVIGALVDAAASVSGVLGRPAPVALFQGFGESALNFELRAWTDRFDDWGAVRSQLAVAVNERLKSEGIAMPFPQREVTLHFPSREKT